MKKFPQFFYFSARCVYLPLKFLLKPLGRFPRLQDFGIAMRQAIQDLLKTTEETGGSAATITPNKTPKEGGVPGWLIEEMHAIHQIEPKIFPSDDLVQSIPEHCVPDSKLTGHYLDLSNRYGTDVSHVFLVPWLNRGGADLLALNYVQAVNDFQKAANIVVIATYPTESKWAARLPKNVRFIDFGRLYEELSLDEQRKLLILLLLQQAPKVIHNINSELGYIAYCLHGNALSASSKLYASSFCFDYSEEGQRVGYSAGYIPECYDNLEAVLTDNASHVDEMMGLFGFTKDKFRVHYQPAPEAGKSVILREGNKEKLDILWAGRMDRQKRPDLLLEIAKRSKQLPFTFHVYGSSVLNADLYSVAIAEAENIHFHGPFDGLTSLELKDLDAYLYTSQWDGLPNILLEAVAMGLPVVASDVGGISELILDGETGLLVRPFDDIDQYIKAFTKLSESSSLCWEFISNSQQLLLSRHTWDKFHAEIETIPHYI